MTLGKTKGNQFERKMARTLGSWIFSDEEMLWRDSTSGGRKQIYRGDIVPAKAHGYPWNTWPFLIELKYGYKNHIPTFNSQTKLREWLSKLLSELDDLQGIPILIVQYHRQKPLLITTLTLNFYNPLSINIIYDDKVYNFFVYNFDQLLLYEFNTLLPEGFLEYVTDNFKNPKKEEDDNIEYVLGEIFNEPPSNDTEFKS